jgi:hypothetical protein
MQQATEVGGTVDVVTGGEKGGRRSRRLSEVATQGLEETGRFPGKRREGLPIEL